MGVTLQTTHPMRLNSDLYFLGCIPTNSQVGINVTVDLYGTLIAPPYLCFITVLETVGYFY